MKCPRLSRSRGPGCLLDQGTRRLCPQGPQDPCLATPTPSTATTPAQGDPSPSPAAACRGLDSPQPPLLSRGRRQLGSLVPLNFGFFGSQETREKATSSKVKPTPTPGPSSLASSRELSGPSCSRPILCASPGPGVQLRFSRPQGKEAAGCQVLSRHLFREWEVKVVSSPQDGRRGAKGAVKGQRPRREGSGG